MSGFGETGASMSKVLVTGGHGFIGHHVCGAFWRQGHDVVVIDNLSMGVHLAPKGVQDLIMPLYELQQTKLQDIDFCVHCAARADVSANWDSLSERELIWGSNVLGTIDLLEALPETCPIVFLSSGSIYGDAVNGLEGEYYPCTSPYAASKVAGEALIQAYAHKRGVPWWVFRLGCAVGAGYHHGHIADMVEGCKRGHFHAKNDGRTRKSFVNVLDVAAACLSCHLYGPPSGVYNLAKDSWSWRDTLACMDKVASGREYQVTCEARMHGWVGDPMAILGTEKAIKTGFAFPRSVEEGVVEALRTLGWGK